MRGRGFARTLLVRVQHENLRATVTITGTGPPLVLIPSMLILTRTYHALIEQLRKHFRVIAIELPGSGVNSRLVRPWSFYQYASWFLDLLDQMRLERCILLGHSNSAAVALLAATMRPERFSHLILADAAGTGPSRPVWKLMLGRAPDAVVELRFSAWAVFHVLFNLLAHRRNWNEQIRLVARDDLSDEAQRVTVPTLVAWGGRDFTVPLSHGTRLHAMIANSRLHVYRNGSHDWLITNAEHFVHVVLGFVNGNRARSLRELVRT